MVYLAKAYDDTATVRSEAYSLVCETPSCTHQSFVEECDILNILSSHDALSMIEAAAHRPKQYLDCSIISDYHAALNQVISANDAFNELPSHVRARFKNDPGAFVDFFNDPANLEEAISLGLAAEVPEGKRAQHAGVPSGTSPAEGGDNPSQEA